MIDMRIRALLARVDDAEVRAALEREFAQLADQRTVGLVFEHHMPEVVALPAVPVARGRFARRRDGDERMLRVLRVRAGVAICEEQRAGDDDVEWQAAVHQIPVADLVTVARFGDAVYSGLRHVETMEHGEPGVAPAHVLINAENHHALQLLQWTHPGGIDLIYIDPPYNTGNKTWAYNDRYVAETDGFRHSKWLSFMERRLELAKSLLKPTGVIIVAIGDAEHHRLRMLMDQIFGEQNFLANVVWQGGRKNDSRYVSRGADYMLVYANVEAALAERGVRWRETKGGLDEILAAGERAWARSNGDPDEATRMMKSWWRSLPAGHPALASKHYDHICGVTGEVFFPDNVSWPGGGGPTYEILHPTTGLPVPVPSRGWMYQEDKMKREIAAGHIHFGPDHTRGLNRKTYLKDVSSQVADSVFYQDRRSAAKRLAGKDGVFRDKRFPFPKDHTVLMRWIRLTAPKNAVILDFFGGSGSTLEAVVRLNEEDGGTRQGILVTNNELSAADATALTKQGHRPGDAEYEARGVFQHVTSPRIRTVVTGTRDDGSTYSEGIPARVESFELTHLDPERVQDGRGFAQLAPLLWLQAGGRGPIIERAGDDGWATTEHYALLTSIDAAEQLIASMPASVQRVFIVTNAVSEFQQVAAALPEQCEPVQLPEGYLSAFARQVGT